MNGLTGDSFGVLDGFQMESWPPEGGSACEKITG